MVVGMFGASYVRKWISCYANSFDSWVQNVRAELLHELQRVLSAPVAGWAYSFFNLDSKDIIWIPMPVPAARITNMPFKFPPFWSRIAKAIMAIAQVPTFTMATVYNPFICLLKLFSFIAISPS